MTLSGYATLHGAPDLEGDVVRAGAARASLNRMGWRVPMLVAHDLRAVTGWWRAHEDGRGLYVEGEVDRELPGGRLAETLIARGGDGLSIGFRTRRFSPRPEGGRVLVEIDLLEVSLVAAPMQPLARFSVGRARVAA
jgi:hypothetical protein